MEVDFWPDGVPREETVEAFIGAFRTRGFDRVTQSEAVEPHIDKVALFTAADGVPTHACYQLPNGRWSSKLGRSADVEHDLRDVECSTYGRVAIILARDNSRRIILG